MLVRLANPPVRPIAAALLSARERESIAVAASALSVFGVAFRQAKDDRGETVFVMDPAIDTLTTFFGMWLVWVLLLLDEGDTRTEPSTFWFARDASATTAALCGGAADQSAGAHGDHASRGRVRASSLFLFGWNVGD